MVGCIGCGGCMLSYDGVVWGCSREWVGQRVTLLTRTWIINPWTGDRINYPQPICPRNGALGWARLIAATQKRF
eukprot:5932361-Prymnesium_polylepis.1